MMLRCLFKSSPKASSNCVTKLNHFRYAIHTKPAVNNKRNNWMKHQIHMKPSSGDHGWTESVFVPFSSSISPLQRIYQMNGDIIDRDRLKNEFENYEQDIKIRAVEIWENANESVTDISTSSVEIWENANESVTDI